MSKHARYSPSKLGYKELCSKFERVETTDGSDNEGTMLHLAYETGDTNGLSYDQTKWVNELLDYTNGIIKQLGEGTKEYKEKRVEVPDVTYGTADRIIVSADEKWIVIIDAKFVRKAVTEASDNVQLMAYALGASYAFPSAERIDVHIASPRIDDYTQHTYYRKDMAGIQARIEAIIARCNDPFDPPRRCELCQDCQHLSRCPEQKGLIAWSANLVTLDLPSSVDVAQLCESELGKLKEIATLAGNLLEQVGKDINKRVAEEGLEIPGYKLVRKEGRVSFKEEKLTEVNEALIEAAGLDRFKAVAKISHGDACALLSEAGIDNAKAYIEVCMPDALQRGAVSEYLMKTGNRKTKKAVGIEI